MSSAFLNRIVLAGLIPLVALTACTSGDKTPSQTGSGKPEAPPAAPPAASVKPTGRVIAVELYSDEKGNYFKPADIEAHRGDVVRFTLKSGVHNVHFLPDSNPGAQNLPPASDFLQLPDQTFELVVGFAPGHYYFQCDPHALLGMKGHLEVEDEK
jgi:plastocyanin